jgi:hypothetical protein
MLSDGLASPREHSPKAENPRVAGSPMARQLAPGGFMLRSGRPACGPVSLLAQKAGGPQLRPQAPLLFAGHPQYLVGFVFFGERPEEQQDVKNEAFDLGEVSIRAMVPGVGGIGWELGGAPLPVPAASDR